MHADPGGRACSPSSRSAGTYREDMFQRDLAAIGMAYLDQGFVNVKVGKPSIGLSAGPALPLHLHPHRGGRAVLHRQDGLHRRAARRGAAAAAPPPDPLRRALLPLQGRRRTSSPSATSTRTGASPTPTSRRRPGRRRSGSSTSPSTSSPASSAASRDRGRRQRQDPRQGGAARAAHLRGRDLQRRPPSRTSKGRVTALGFFETVEITTRARGAPTTSSSPPSRSRRRPPAPSSSAPASPATRTSSSPARSPSRTSSAGARP